MELQDSATVSSPFGDEVLETAYTSVVAELEALAPADLIPINLDIIVAVNTAAGVIPEIKALRAEIAAELPKFDLKSFDNLYRYTMAVGYAHTMHLIATGPQDDLRPLFEEAVQLRETLLTDATALAGRGVINGEVLRSLRGANGYKNVQLDLQMLVNVFKGNWAKVKGKCGATEAELARGEKLVASLIEVVGQREQGPAEIAKTADMRMRAFTLFTRTYDNARRAVTYLRWRTGDVDDIIPSLYAGRSNGRAGTSKREPEPSVDSPSTPNQLAANETLLSQVTAQPRRPEIAEPTAEALRASGGPFAG